jgi:hypothetical protein
MKAILRLGVLVVFGTATHLQAQVVDARNDLVLPVNPPRSAGNPKAADLEQQFPLLLSILHTSTELDNAKAEGLGPDHPRIKALEAKLKALQNTLQPGSAKDENADAAQSVLDRLAQLEARQKEKEAELSREVAALKAEVARLQEELKKAKR